MNYFWDLPCEFPSCLAASGSPPRPNTSWGHHSDNAGGAIKGISQLPLIADVIGHCRFLKNNICVSTECGVTNGQTGATRLISQQHPFYMDMPSTHICCPVYNSAPSILIGDLSTELPFMKCILPPAHISCLQLSCVLKQLQAVHQTLQWCTCRTILFHVVISSVSCCRIILRAEVLLNAIKLIPGICFKR